MGEKEKSYLDVASLEHIKALHAALVDVMGDIDRDESTITEIYEDKYYCMIIDLLEKTHDMLREGVRNSNGKVMADTMCSYVKYVGIQHLRALSDAITAAIKDVDKHVKECNRDQNRWYNNLTDYGKECIMEWYQKRKHNREKKKYGKNEETD